MTEGLFVLTVIFVAYVFYVIINEKKALLKSTLPAVDPEKPAVFVASVSSEPAPKKEQSKIKAPTTVKSTANEKPASATQDTRKKGLKNPKTGEISPSNANYIFTKRWIKEALVTEGLLEKVYKNNEINAEIEAAIKAAITKLEAMEHYKV